MTGFRVLKRASMWLAGAATLPALAVAQTTPSGPQTDPSLDRFSLPPSVRPSPRPTPTSGPIIAPLSRPTPAAPIVLATPTPTPAPVRQPTVTPSASVPAPSATAARRLPPSAQPTAVPSPAAIPTTAAATPEPTPIPTASPSPTATEAAPTAAPSTGWSTGWSTGLVVGVGAALLALVATGGFLLGRRRAARADEPVETFVPDPAATSQPAATLPEPAIAPSGNVTVPARRHVADEPQPRLDIALIPKRAGTNLMSAAVDYRVVVRNAGTLPARDIRFAMYMLSASARQAQELQSIFAATIDRPMVPPFELAPGQDMELSGMAMLPRDRVNVMTIDGKQCFVPVLAMKADYRWGDNVGAPGVVTAAHVIGIERGEGAKLAPFRLDGGPHMHPEVAERKVA